MQQQAPQIDLSNTTGLKNSTGGSVFLQGVLLRTVSKFVAGTPEDALMPIPVFYDQATGKILKDSIPNDIRDEFEGEIL